ncbi:MAG: insulinase family protein [Clostridia bacterium]|nr:insulinase family protein [Clostridia bacterium]
MRTKIIKLPYGATLIHTRNNANKAINVQINFKVGSANTSYKPGLLHLAEHLRANRTKELTKEQLTEENTKKGISFNASTGNIFIDFNLITHKKFLKEAFSKLVERMLFEDLTKEEYEKEKEIVCAEINRAKANIERQFYEKLKGKVYLDKFRNTNNLGEKKDIKRYTNRQIQNHISKIINTNNLIVTVSGNVSSCYIKRLIKQILLTQIPHDEPKVKQLEIDPIFANKSKLIISKNEYEANSLLIIIPTKITNNKDLRQLFQKSYIISLLSGNDGEIFKALRYRNGLIYSSSTFSKDNSKSIYMKFQTKKENINKAISLIAEVFNNLAITKEKKEEIDNRAKILDEMTYRKRNGELNDSFLNSFLFYGKLIKKKVGDKIIKKMTADEINAKIKDMMTDNKIYVLVEGNADKKDVMSIKKIENLFFGNVDQNN